MSVILYLDLLLLVTFSFLSIDRKEGVKRRRQGARERIEGMF